MGPGVVDPVPATRARHLSAVAALLGAALLFAVAAVWGRRLIGGGAALYVAAPPFAGSRAWLWPRGRWAAVALGTVLVALWVPATERLR